jgi:hypothetical protein
MTHVLDLQSMDAMDTPESPLASQVTWAACGSTVTLVLCTPAEPE